MKKTDDVNWFKQEEWNLKYVLPLVVGRYVSETTISVMDVHVFEHEDEGVVRLLSDNKRVTDHYGFVDHDLLPEGASEELSQDEVIRNYIVTGDSTVHEKMNGAYVEGLEVDGIVFSTNDHILDYPELSFREFIDEFVLRKPANWQFENIESLKSKLLDENSLLKAEY